MDHFGIVELINAATLIAVSVTGWLVKMVLARLDRLDTELGNIDKQVGVLQSRVEAHDQRHKETREDVMFLRRLILRGDATIQGG